MKRFLIVLMTLLMLSTSILSTRNVFAQEETETVSEIQETDIGASEQETIETEEPEIAEVQEGPKEEILLPAEDVQEEEPSDPNDPSLCTSVLQDPSSKDLVVTSTNREWLNALQENKNRAYVTFSGDRSIWFENNYKNIEFNSDDEGLTGFTISYKLLLNNEIKSGDTSISFNAISSFKPFSLMIEGLDACKKAPELTAEDVYFDEEKNLIIETDDAGWGEAVSLDPEDYNERGFIRFDSDNKSFTVTTGIDGFITYEDGKIFIPSYVFTYEEAEDDKYDISFEAFGYG